jgi:hypothetical protein
MTNRVYLLCQLKNERTKNLNLGIEDHLKIMWYKETENSITYLNTSGTILTNKQKIETKLDSARYETALIFSK